MTADEDNNQEETTEAPQESDTLDDRLIKITGIVNEISDKADEILKNVEEMHDMVSANHGMPSYEPDFMDDSEEE